MEVTDFVARHYTCVTLLPDRSHDLHSFALMVEQLPTKRLPATLEVVDLGTVFPDGRRLLITQIVVCVGCQHDKGPLLQTATERFRRSVTPEEHELLSKALTEEGLAQLSPQVGGEGEWH